MRIRNIQKNGEYFFPRSILKGEDILEIETKVLSILFFRQEAILKSKRSNSEFWAFKGGAWGEDKDEMREKEKLGDLRSLGTLEIYY